MAESKPDLLSVWTEVRNSNEGISASLIAEWSDGLVTVEDEMWLTSAEINESNGISSLNLSAEARNSIQENNTSVEDWIDGLSTVRILQEGEKVYDVTGGADWSDTDAVIVENMTDTRADEYVVESKSWKQFENTVADLNPNYPVDDPVVEGHYVGSEKTYAFPRSRLEVIDE